MHSFLIIMMFNFFHSNFDLAFLLLLSYLNFLIIYLIPSLFILFYFILFYFILAFFRSMTERRNQAWKDMQRDALLIDGKHTHTHTHTHTPYLTYTIPHVHHTIQIHTPQTHTCTTHMHTHTCILIHT